MTSPRLLQVPGFVPLGIRIDTAPAWWWPAAQFAALWPTWLWMTRRMVDGTDDPLGLLSLIALGWFIWQARGQLRAAPRLDWLVLAIAGTLLATLAHVAWQPLAACLIALASLASGLLAFVPSRLADLPAASITRNTFINRVCLKALFCVVMVLCLVCAGM